MKTRLLLLIALSVPLAGHAAEPSGPEPVEATASASPNDVISRVQQKLLDLGFDAGQVNGELNEKMQAALAQFQLSRVIPAGGQLDDVTLAELGIEQDAL